MNAYDDLSREDLIRLIGELQAENRRLAAEHGCAPCTETSAGDPPSEEGSTCSGSVCFRQRYSDQIFAAIPDMITILHRDGSIAALLSSDATNHTGVPREKLIGSIGNEFLSPEAFESIRLNFTRAMQTGVGSTAYHEITLDGQTRHYENRIFRLDDRYALCLCRDITAEQHAKQELEEIDRRRSAAEKIASLSHWFYNERTDTFSGPFVEQGESPDNESAAQEDRIDSLIHPDDRKRLVKLLASSEMGGDLSSSARGLTAPTTTTTAA